MGWAVSAGAWSVCVFVGDCGRLVYNVFVGDAFVRAHNISARCGFVQSTLKEFCHV
jgi:roadblock/LC7 domain-containing protein